MSSPARTISQQLATWAHRLRLGDVPGAVQRAASLHLLDGLGTALAAARSGAAVPALNVAAGLGGPPEATILGSRIRVCAPAAALANGTLVHALDFDDTHPGGLVHATAAVLPAAFAVGEQVGAAGAEVLRAVIAGYETVCRVAAAVPHGFHARGIHATSACGVLASALAASLLAGTPDEVTVSAMGVAGSAAGGLLEFLNTGASTKQLHPGMAGLNGILAARLSGSGASGPASVLEGDKGLYRALSAHPASLRAVLDGLGERWETTAIAIKPYPACQLIHAALDAAAEVLGELPDAARINRVVADVHPDSVPIICEPRPAKVRPSNGYEARFSLPWSVAAMLTDRSVTLATYTPGSISRPAVADLAARVEARVVTTAGPAADAPSRVSVDLADGRRITGTVRASRGTSQIPMPEQDVVRKFLENCGDDPSARRLAVAVMDLGSLPSLQPVLDLAGRIGMVSPPARSARRGAAVDARPGTRGSRHRRAGRPA